MDLISVLGDLGDFVGGLGVVVTLAYLAWQIRQNSQLLRLNTRATEAATRQAFATQDLTFIRTALDPALTASAITKARRGDDLSDVDLLQLNERQHLNFRIFENAYYQFKKGTLEPGEWNRYERIIPIAFDEAAQMMWDTFEPSFSPDFAAEVDRLRQASVS